MNIIYIMDKPICALTCEIETAFKISRKLTQAINAIVFLNEDFYAKTLGLLIRNHFPPR